MEIKKEAWDKFISSMDFESNTNNFKFDFKAMTKSYGQAYMVFCQASWLANDGVLDEIEFMRMNANMPQSYFDKVIRKIN